MHKIILALAASVFASPASASIAVYTDRAALAAVASLPTVETFTSTYHFFLPHKLNSSTTDCCAFGDPISPGDLLPGVTYSVAGSGYGFAIDLAYDLTAFDGVFLDDVDPSKTLTASFSAPQLAFGFDTSRLFMPDFTVSIRGNRGELYAKRFDHAAGGFYGFASDSANVRSVTVHSWSGDFGFALDNFSYDATRVAAAPEPAAWSIMVVGFGLIGSMRRLRSRREPVA